jgi:cytochrome c556
VKRRLLGSPAVLMITAAAGLCLLGSISGMALADEPASAQATVDTRRAGLKKMGAAMKALSEQLRTDAPDTAKLVATSQVIMAGAAQVPTWFPAGTDNGTGLDTDALPYIWKDRGKFDALATQLVAESRTLAAAATAGNLAAVRSQTTTVQSVCKSCHSSFRAD